jgi:sirohydrochlorin ferrochelatase
MVNRPGLYASGLLAWARGEDTPEVQAAVYRVARTLQLVESALRPKGERG